MFISIYIVSWATKLHTAANKRSSRRMGQLSDIADLMQMIRYIYIYLNKFSSTGISRLELTNFLHFLQVTIKAPFLCILGNNKFIFLCIQCKLTTLFLLLVYCWLHEYSYGMFLTAVICLCIQCKLTTLFLLLVY